MRTSNKKQDTPRQRAILSYTSIEANVSNRPQPPTRWLRNPPVGKSLAQETLARQILHQLG
eukprot:6809716-Lingulodinium_polyedra.AAC.1